VSPLRARRQVVRPLPGDWPRPCGCRRRLVTVGRTARAGKLLLKNPHLTCTRTRSL
jgi:hypothetical protein